MKVRITHSLDLSEVPDQLIDFVSRFSDAIKQMDSKSDDCLGAASVSSDSPFKYRLLHECVAGLRTQIADLDQELNDFGLLLSGYINIIEKRAWVIKDKCLQLIGAKDVRKIS